MTITELGGQPHAVRQEAAALLVRDFDDHPRGWPDLAAAAEEVTHVIRLGFAFAAIEGSRLLGWIGGLPEYEGRVWELHPLVVRREHRPRGVGRALVAAFEREARRRGGAAC